MKDAFSKYHPLVNFSYFALVFGFSMVFMHPALLLISLICALLYSIELKGKKALKRSFYFLLPSMLITALINPVFNHEGATIIGYFYRGNPLTLESILYGLAAATMLGSVIIWFTSYNEIMTSDKFIYIFARLIPSLSLIISMALRFVPRFKAQIKEVSNAQRSIGRDISYGGVFERMGKGITILSIVISWALENSIETADSMKSRGYGLEARTAFSIYRFDKRDKKALLAIILLGGYILLGGIFGGLRWRYFPTMKGRKIDLYSLTLWIAYTGLFLLPLIVNRREAKQWKATKLKN